MPHKHSPRLQSRRLRTKATLILLALVTLGLYGATLMRFGVLMGGGP